MRQLQLEQRDTKENYEVLLRCGSLKTCFKTPPTILRNEYVGVGKNEFRGMTLPLSFKTSIRLGLLLYYVYKTSLNGHNGYRVARQAMNFPLQEQ